VFLDLQLFDFRAQRRSGNSESRCRTFWAGDSSLAISQRGFNDFSLLILESVWQGPWQILAGLAPGWPAKPFSIQKVSPLVRITDLKCPAG
jgi:hypothetical protein